MRCMTSSALIYATHNLIKSTKKGTNWSLPRYYGDSYAYKLQSLQVLCTICFLSERCQHPVIPQNGWLIGNNFAHGGNVRIVCKFKNRTLDLRRSSKITCNHGVWSGPILSCEGKDRFVNVDSECVVLC